jgi:hypothetical protein
VKDGKFQAKTTSRDQNKTFLPAIGFDWKWSQASRAAAPRDPNDDEDEQDEEDGDDDEGDDHEPAVIREPDED